MATAADPIGFTSLRLRTTEFDKICDKLLHTFTEEFRAKGAPRPPRIFRHHRVRDALIIENLMPPADSVSRDHPRVYVDSLCGAAVLRGADVFACGVVGCEVGAKQHQKVSVFACTSPFNAGFKKFDGTCEFVGNGELLIDSKLLLGNIKANRGVAVSMSQPMCVCPTFQSSLFAAGAAVAQNLPSLVCSWVLDCENVGCPVLDMCAAPGGKCLHLADIVGDSGFVIGVDKSSKRLRQVEEAAARLEVTNVRCFCWDSCRLCCDSGSSVTDDESSPPFLPAQFHRILLDAPCSALGQRPLLGNRSRPSNQLESFVTLQRRLFKTAYKLLKPGGVLVYSTCTTVQDENENLVSWALDKFGLDLRLGEQTPNLRPLTLASGWPAVQKFDFSKRDSWPAGDTRCDYDTIGFFIAKFEKANSATAAEVLPLASG